MTLQDYSVFEYLYRDASNYKSWGELLLVGRLGEKDLARIRHRFEGGMYFIAEQLRVPTLYEQLWGCCDDGPSDDDHVWHEFHAVRPATDADRLLLPVWGDARALVGAIWNVERWNEALSRNWVAW